MARNKIPTSKSLGKVPIVSLTRALSPFIYIKLRGGAHRTARPQIYAFTHNHCIKPCTSWVRGVALWERACPVCRGCGFIPSPTKHHKAADCKLTREGPLSRHWLCSERGEMREKRLNSDSGVLSWPRGYSSNRATLGPITSFPFII